MKYLVTLEIDDPEGAMGDSPDTKNVRAWGHYLDIAEDEVVRVVKVEAIT